MGQFCAQAVRYCRKTRNARWNLRRGTATRYLYPRSDIAMAFLDNDRTRPTHCPPKGDAHYFSVVTKKPTLDNVAWSYEDPTIAGRESKSSASRLLPAAPSRGRAKSRGPPEGPKNFEG